MEMLALGSTAPNFKSYCLAQAAFSWVEGGNSVICSNTLGRGVKVNIVPDKGRLAGMTPIKVWLGESR